MQGKSADAIDFANQATANVAREMEKILEVWRRTKPDVAQSAEDLAVRLRQATRAKRGQ
jgi:hypothetical protein